MARSTHKLLHPEPLLRFDGIKSHSETVRRILGTASDPAANAVWVGDKRLLVDVSRTAFVMFRVQSRSWVALGDPVGPPAARERLLRRYCELCERYRSRPVFYQVTERFLTTYADMGLRIAKLGEDGHVPLRDFSLEGSARAELRHARSRAKREGATFEVVRQAAVDRIVPELAAVSSEWLRMKAAAEKGFSLGRFSPDYLRRFDCAVVRRDGRIVAFANLWPAPRSSTLGVDLMRYGTAAPKTVMDYLFAELMLWAKARAYETFSLGMAPLSGLEDDPLTPIWRRIGNLIFHHAESFYDFEGLRRYKEKFNPVWLPRYLACPGGLALPRVLLDCAILVSGGLRRAIPHGARPPGRLRVSSSA